jgi:predicted regulator of Ras-like GTPase activity (Roadblock/LC7/MglB family)
MTDLEQLIADLTDSLQETRVLAVVSWDGDPWYAENEELDAEAILTRARDVLERAEEYRDA